MAASSRFEFVPDKKGVLWDLLLYIPTLIALISVATQLWYSGNKPFTYVLIFMTTIIFLIAYNRILKTRLMVLGSSPVALDISKHSVVMELKSGEPLQLVKDVRFFSDMAGRSFALSGIDGRGKKQQHVFHKGQFSSEKEFDSARAILKIFK